MRDNNDEDLPMFIDIHTHAILLHDPRQRRISRWTAPDELLQMWDDLGIARGVVLPLVHHEIGAILQTTENVLDIYNLYPDRIIPFCNLDPRWQYNNPNNDFTPILEHYKELGCKGFGEFVANLWWDDDRVLNLLSHLEKVGLPVLFHVASKERGQYGLVLRQIPNLLLTLEKIGLPRQTARPPVLARSRRGSGGRVVALRSSGVARQAWPPPVSSGATATR
jgi:predicted TIM-barrel fold metal-dependent hydrolase